MGAKPRTKSCVSTGRDLCKSVDTSLLTVHTGFEDVRSSGYDLTAMTSAAARASGVSRLDIQPGDVLIVKTRNSVYAVRSLGESSFSVSGGWFDKKFGGPFHTTIAGCTWGGTVLKRDLVAACGMHLEFGNRVVTSAIQQICHFRGRNLN